VEAKDVKNADSAVMTDRVLQMLPNSGHNTVIAGEINERERDFIAMSFGIQTWSKLSV
jgi:hypothetical protein